ncbi:MAG: hypothetical protein CFE23_08305 [Flavobacterium sp. BFFFF1]|uniref:ABC transporter permease n=1 Tax=Flavobacterium sp. BFFFF1 TaxID=2015557 RepID=UPI000BD5E759|nr:FtsX-like permease family protein [Flavobacterium sp. BFFFF1]OYU80711.1 MAG: hypothetical protein CFE23_08305 [Flavobacterium sp. BFFFF1]
MVKDVNIEIALTHVITRKKQTIVAALGVTIGVGIYLFMNSLGSGFTSFSRNEIFKNNAHIKIYKDDELSVPITKNTTNTGITLIVNPQITTLSKKIINPEALLQQVKKQPYVTNALAQVNFDAFYNKGKAQIKGTGNGVVIADYNAMFNLGKYMVAGSINSLNGNNNGIIIGSGIAKKLCLGLNNSITVSSSFNVIKVMKIVGIFTTGNSMNDQQKSYVNIATAQQFLKEGPSYVSTIFINTPNPDNTESYVKKLQRLTHYTVEDWKTTNADVLMGAISFSILFVAAFGIYNILSATITQKINDIAILKATGFSSGDVVRVFVLEALIMGCIGTFFGLILGAILIAIMSKIYMGGPVGYFPISFELNLFAYSLMLGIFITVCAGYFPARRAARIDPVEIFRK